MTALVYDTDALLQVRVAEPHPAFRAKHADESVGDYNAARDKYRLQQLFARVDQLEAANKALAAAYVELVDYVLRDKVTPA